MSDNLSRCTVYGSELADSYRSDPERRAELLVYDRLIEQLGADWILFYDVAWLAPAGDGAAKDGQTDFVLAHPRLGILVLEVKGGGIRYDGNARKWFTKNARGEFEIDPVNQVKHSKFTLLHKLKSIGALERFHIDIFHSIAFPDVQVPNSTPIDAPKSILIGADELQYLSEKIESVFAYWKGEDEAEGGETVSRHLCELLSRSCDFPNPLRIASERDEQEILRLTTDQYRILDALNRTRRVAVGGCAGSGKTYLAVEKARRLVLQGYKVLLTCFNRALADHLSALATKHENLTVLNWHSLCRQVASAAAISLPPFDRAANNAGLDEAYADALCSALEKDPSLKYDAVIVDEGQDFEYQWWLGLEACLKPNGFLYVFYDDNQTLYRGRGNLPSNMTEILLQENIRNAKPIFDIVSRFYKNDDGAEMVGKGPAGRSVEKICYVGESDLQRLVGKTLSRLVINEQISTRDVVVLTPKRLDRSCLLQGKLPGPIQLVANDSSKKNEVMCSTIHSFKGLERKVVLVAELDEEFLGYRTDDLAKRCYVGFSRAKTHLAVFGTSRVLEELVD